MQISLSTWILIQLSKMNTADKGAQMATNPRCHGNVALREARGYSPGKGVSSINLQAFVCSSPLLWNIKCMEYFVYLCAAKRKKILKNSSIPYLTTTTWRHHLRTILDPESEPLLCSYVEFCVGEAPVKLPFNENNVPSNLNKRMRYFLHLLFGLCCIAATAAVIY